LISTTNPQLIPEFLYETTPIHQIDPRDDSAIEKINSSHHPLLVSVADDLPLPVVPAFRLLAAKLHPRHPILLKDTLNIHHHTKETELSALLRSSVNLGSLLCDGIGDAILVRCEQNPNKALHLAYNILQASGTRIFKTEFVACPSCGRTLFDLQSTTARIRAATAHLPGLKIAVMGCIVNGPGEMADADFGYVGGAPGKINLYVGKTPVRFNIPEEKAVEELISLIRQHGKWKDPENSKNEIKN
ncbi:MAG: flavodoxin-dependent (E)-4-hydroxy-3-methylbut-2-enyl-diphosphate synthase, partial [Chthoniobacterales bacterium]|nr:flavodoxin-dependent (E)-4-hydroxy-3-methylbut-2-enyl-diphosphate synthase [Chthoniobacterales bacterium]